MRSRVDYGRPHDEKFLVALPTIPLGKTPLAAEPADAALLQIDASYIFEMLVDYSDRCRERDSLDGLKFYVDGVRMEPYVALENLPVLSDKSLEGYHRRMAREFRDYALVCDGLVESMRETSIRSAKAWEIITDFTTNLFHRTGVPNRFAEIGLYLGNYRKTPFGVHIDRCGVFSLPVVGTKTFRTWAPDVVEKYPELKEAFSYDEFKSKSLVLRAQPGEITYWPSTHWHIAEGDGSFSATWSIGVWVDRPLTDVASSLVTNAVNRSLKNSLKRRASKTSLPLPARSNNGFVKTLPTDLHRALEVALATPRQTLKNDFLTWWLAHLSTGGFQISPSTTKPVRALKPGDVVLGVADKPIYWSRLSKREIAWAYNGKLDQTVASKEIVSILKTLNAGRPITVSSRHTKAARALLNQIHHHSV